MPRIKKDRYEYYQNGNSYDVLKNGRYVSKMSASQFKMYYNNRIDPKKNEWIDRTKKDLED